MNAKRGNALGFEKPKVTDSDLAEKVLEKNMQGLLLYQMGDYLSAKELFEECIELDPEFAEPYDHMYAVYHRLGQDDLALDSLMTFLKLAAPDNPQRERYEPIMRMYNGLHRIQSKRTFFHRLWARFFPKN